MSRVDIEQLKRGNPIEAVIRRHGVELRGERRPTGRCPFHEDRTPSLSVYPETGSFHCFGCGASGDVIDFVRRAEGLGFREAVIRLGGEAAGGMAAGASPDAPLAGAPRRHQGAASGTAGGAHPPPARPPAQERAERAPALSLDDRLLLTAACELYHETLLKTPAALRYLEGRGIPSWLARRRRLGTSDGRRLLPYLRRRRLSLKRAGELGLLFRSGEETMAGRIVIPDLRGAHCGWMVGRALSGDGTPKYRGLSLPKPLLGYEPGRRRLFVTEGPFDWLTLVGWGLPACALLGTEPGRGQLRRLERARSVVLVMDRDDAGREAARRLSETLGGRARVLELPEGAKDVSELGARPGGREAFFGAARRRREGGAACRRRDPLRTPASPRSSRPGTSRTASPRRAGCWARSPGSRSRSRSRRPRGVRAGTCAPRRTRASTARSRSSAPPTRRRGPGGCLRSARISIRPACSRASGPRPWSCGPRAGTSSRSAATGGASPRRSRACWRGRSPGERSGSSPG